MLKNFIHFGCWNNGGCQPDTTNDLWRVMKRLKEFVPKPSFIVIAGDNYYPTKTVVDKKKQKRLYTDKFESGFRCLPSNVPIYMNYGNHDLETGLIINEVKEKTCALTSMETSIVNTLNADNYNINLKLFQEIQFNSTTVIIMIDTTIYDDTDDTTCYKAVNEEYSAIGEGDIRNVIKDKQRDFVNEIVGKINDNPLIKNIIIVGHHPIINFKLKKDNCNLLNLFILI